MRAQELILIDERSESYEFVARDRIQISTQLMKSRGKRQILRLFDKRMIGFAKVFRDQC